MIMTSSIIIRNCEEYAHTENNMTTIHEQNTQRKVIEMKSSTCINEYVHVKQFPDYQNDIPNHV